MTARAHLGPEALQKMYYVKHFTRVASSLLACRAGVQHPVRASCTQTFPDPDVPAGGRLLQD